MSVGCQAVEPSGWKRVLVPPDCNTSTSDTKLTLSIKASHVVIFTLW